MAIRLSKLFGIDIYSVDGEYRGKVFDLIINLEKGKIETITTEALKPRTKQEAKRILSEKSIPYKKVKSAKDILIIDNSVKTSETKEDDEHHRQSSRHPTKSSKISAEQIRYKY